MTAKATALVHSAAVSLIDGHDAAAATQLLKLFRDAQAAGRRIMALGLFAWEIKETRLKHGQWGPWLAAHCPDLSRLDEKTQKPKASSALSSYMQMTKDVLEDMGYTIEKYFAHIAKFPTGSGICHGGKFLLLPENKKLPAPVAELRSEICSRVEGKTAKQIRLAFGQVEEDETTGEVKPKRGRLKGQGGASKEQRAAAAAAEEAARVEALELESKDTAKWLIENADDKRAGAMSDATKDNLFESLETMRAYLLADRKARQAAKGTQP